jgi:hypothetical protein
MLNKMQKSAFVIVAGLLAVLAWCPHPAFANEDGAGIWTYNADWSIALINLTNYPLTYMRPNEAGAHLCPTISGDQYELYNMLACGTDWEVEPFRTKLWVTDPYMSVSPNSYSGKMTLYSEGFPEWKFDLVWINQTAYHLPTYGNWTGLSPFSSDQGWVLPDPDVSSTCYNDDDSSDCGTSAYHRWATPVNDTKPHNVMTLIGPKIMVSLFAGDNNHLNVVIQQLYEEDDAGNVLWDDSGAYQSYPLDFVDNCGNYTPTWDRWE